MIPVFKNARHNGQEHLPGAVRRASQVRCPAGHVGATVFHGQIELRHADEFPVRAAVRRFGDPDGRAVNPGDTGKPRCIRPAVGAKHPPIFYERVPDNRRVRRAVVNRVAVKRLGCDRSGSSTSASRERQQK